MTWPEAIYKIIIDGGGGILTAVVLLALFSNFWDNVFGRTPERVTVEKIPSQVIGDLMGIAGEMSATFVPTRAQVRDWAERINDAIS